MTVIDWFCLLIVGLILIEHYQDWQYIIKWGKRG